MQRRRTRRSKVLSTTILEFPSELVPPLNGIGLPYVADPFRQVSFNSKVDEGLRIQQLSGGQKSLVALATGASLPPPPLPLTA